MTFALDRPAAAANRVETGLSGSHVTVETQDGRVSLSSPLGDRFNVRSCPGRLPPPARSTSWSISFLAAECGDDLVS